MMSRKSPYKLPQDSIKFTKTNKNGHTIKLRWEILPEHRHEEYVDFKMKYYVKHATLHVAAGIANRAEATEEYRQILLNYLKDPFYIPVICCVDDEKSDIIAVDSTIVRKKGFVIERIQAQTAEVRRFFEYVHVLVNLCSVQDLMNKYNTNIYLADKGFAVHPDYRGLGITNDLIALREAIAIENGISLGGAWVTSLPTQKASESNGCINVFELSADDLRKILNIKSQNLPKKIYYTVKRVGPVSHL